MTTTAETIERKKFRSGGANDEPRVLLVIEDKSSLEWHSALMRQQGCDVWSCESFNRAMLFLGLEDFDLVAVSQGTAAFEGKEVVHRALEEDRTTPVLVLTRSADMNNYLEAMQLGAVDYLEMPLGPAEFTRILRTHVPYRPAA